MQLLNFVFSCMSHCSRFNILLKANFTKIEPQKSNKLGKKI